MAETKTVSSGVQQLIDKLRGQGVEAGQKEADRIISEANARAREIVDAAKAEADEYRTQARADIQRDAEAAKESLQVAVRDTVVEMRAEMSARFAAQVRRIVAKELQDTEFIRRMILAVAGRAAEAAGDDPVEISVAEALFGEGHPSPEVQDQLDATIFGLSAGVLREGVEIKTAGEGRPGISIRLTGQDVEIDLTEEAVTEALLKHLLPRYRDMARGVRDNQ